MSRIMEEVSQGGANLVERLCAEHTTLADDLRARVRRLEALGLLGDTPHGGPPRVGPFRIMGKLGEGGMGEVFLGQQSEPVRRVAAVKVMRGLAADAAVVARRFEAERQALASLNHPGIAQVLEAGADDRGRPWFAMEYVDGSKITTYCDERELGIEDRIALFLQVCDAVAHAHQNGILHRDLKPGNVMVTERGGQPLVKVIDFGLAKATEASDLELSLLTETGQLLGTPAYMSPEQAGALPGAIDSRTDVYALGVLLHVLLVGKVPLSPQGREIHPMLQMQRLLRQATLVRPSQRVGEMSEAHAAARGESTTSWSRALSGDLDWIVSRALAREQQERYPAVSELAADLRRHLRREVVLAGPPSATYRLGRFLERHRREAIAAGVGLLAVILTGVWYLTSLATELRNFDVLEREIRLAELVRVADDDLWPAEPQQVPPMEAWRDEVLTLLGQRTAFEEALAEVEGRAAGHDGSWSFATPRDRALHASVQRLLIGLDGLGAEDGLLADVEGRMAWALDLVRLTLEAPADAWAAAIDDIASLPLYGGLELEPQLGLVPLARDEASGLWEFAVPQPGTRLPERLEDRWEAEADDTCPVLVLVPGGTLLQGAQQDDPDAPGYFYAPAKAELGGQVVELAPFFLSKYELTQAQYGRVMGENPSAIRRPYRPVESIGWTEASTACGRMGLTLPTGAQWEYAARAGHPSPWWTGPADGGVAPMCGNLADRVFLASEGPEAAAKDIDIDYDDGRASHAAVDAYRPNPFGLHNVIGNVWEWCRDPARRYHLVSPRPGDGLQVPLEPELEPTQAYELRGGSFRSSFSKARSTYRHFQSLDSRVAVFGVRPSRAIQPPVRAGTD
jgi:serine/threonine protein kinase/formylglycine-generating enzyme required for sulfatase activity